MTIITLRWWLFAFLAVFQCEVLAAGSVPFASSGFNPIAVLGAQSWFIGGLQKQIDCTYYLDLPKGFQFTIEVPVASVPTDQASASVAAWPYIRYAFENKVYQRTTVNKDGGPMVPVRIGVALVLHDGTSSSGTRVAMTFSEIEAKLGQEHVGK